jgi:2-methylisocitrate lyase-like PEP mutase family enzyme
MQTAFVSGAAVSATLLGEPDVGLLTPPEMARKCNQIASSNPSMSIIADADTGGGNTLNVQRTVRQLISNGCKGCIMEDQVNICQSLLDPNRLPARYQHSRGLESIQSACFWS